MVACLQSFDAVVVTSPNKTGLHSISANELGENQVAIKTHYSGISTGTDRWVISGRFEWGSFGFPLVPGYQRSGLVTAVGSKVKTVSVGQEVFATASCNFKDATAGWGGHTSFGVCEEFEVFDAQGIPPERSAFGVVAQVGYNAASRITATNGSGVIVIGDGVIGLSGALSARRRGYRVLLVGRHDSRLERVKSLGIDVANSQTTSRKFLQDFQASAVIDTVQNQEAFDLYYPALPATWAAVDFEIPRQGTGEIIYSGHRPDGVISWADMAHLQKQELTIHFVSGWTKARIQSTLELMRAGALPLEEIATTYNANPSNVEKVFGKISEGKSPDLASSIFWK